MRPDLIPEAVLVYSLIVVVVAHRIVSPRLVRLRERRVEHERRMAAHADYEHWHALFGDQHVATYGHFQPPGIVLDETGPNLERLT